MNQSQVYNETGLNDSVNGTPGPSSNSGNYRKVFKPNIGGQASAARSEMNAGHDTGSNDSVERANALALGMTPQSAARSKAGGYEPERREARLK